MRHSESITQKMSVALASLLLVPFLLTQLLAPGVMPKQGAGGLEIVICTEVGLTTVVIGPDGEPIEGPVGGGHDDACPWAVTGQVFVAGVLPAVPVPAVTLHPTLFDLPRAQTALVDLALLPLARAPPRPV